MKNIILIAIFASALVDISVAKADNADTSVEALAVDRLV
jgi:hypothetical protein